MKVETQDFYLSAYLCLQGLQIIEMKNFNTRKLFVFEDNEEFQSLKRKYYFNEANVDPLSFKKQIRKLKALILENNM
jgi:hypothetical protein